MNIRMDHRELALFEAFLHHSKRFVEFGSGGSTVLAARFVKQTIVSVDSSTAWLEDVSNAIAPTSSAEIHFKHVDIGPIKEWGYPVGTSRREQWPQYSTAVWNEAAAQDFDLALIDGRFRVPCFCEAIIHAPVGALIMIHDFHRASYQVVREVARQIASIDTMAVFIKGADSLAGRARELADRHRFDPE